ncbi:MAG TPA: hypothetical protein DEH78_12150 [Solibacterales bacterium]|nr:hypothetical protein [Bryobacterales bacterium]
MIHRRQFVQATASAALLPALARAEAFQTPELLGALRKETGDAPVPGATWFTAENEGDGLSYTFPAGTLAKAKFLSSDMLLDGNILATFSLSLYEGQNGRIFRFSFGALNQCSFRMRMATELVDQRAWMVDREGAFLKPIAGGSRVDLDKVDRLTLVVRRKGPKPVRFCMTPLTWSGAGVPRLANPVLPKGKLLDELGQSTLHEWPAKTRSVDEMKTRVRAQLDRAPAQRWPDTFTRWGGWKERKLGPASGFFRVQKAADRWWLVDPAGYAFWSNGPDCVRVDTDARFDGIEDALTFAPDAKGEFADIYTERISRAGKSINYLAANMIRAVGAKGWREKWSTIALAELKRLRFNTVANWSEWEFAAEAQFPYVRPMSFRPRKAGLIYRDFPDVFHPAFDEDAAAYAAELTTTAKDPAFIGYFLMNEPTWAFSSELPAAGMLYNTPDCATRKELVQFLRKKYDGDAALAAAWKAPATFERVAQGKWPGVLTPEALNDLRGFSVVIVEKYFRTISAACRKVDPNHLNLGMRWAGVPPDWAVEGMKHFDVFSINCYRPSLPRDFSEKIEKMLNMPTMVGEWHFGSLDVGLPASGIGHTRTQADRAKAYRYFVEDAAANPRCVGVHWFTLYDQSALGRFDGENYNIGFLDVTHRPYEEMCAGAIASHERLYRVAAGLEPAFSGKPEYLPLIFL